jgi:hypothetical protein
VTFELARKVADSILYEGYVLYPYRASANKNQMRWQWGVLMPPAYHDLDPSEESFSQTECLLEGHGPETVVRIKVRFLHAQAKTVERVVDHDGSTFRPVDSLEVGSSVIVPWDEAVEREFDATFPLADLLGRERTVPLEAPGGSESEEVRDASGQLAGRIVRERQALSGTLRVFAEEFEGPYGLAKLRLRVENDTAWDEPVPNRNLALRRALVAHHVIVVVEGAEFVSLLDSPEWARPAVASCQNVRTWPVLLGDESRPEVVLSSPIILYDFPVVAPESPQNLFDSTEIDEILTLRTMTLTEEEKREARGTDPRVAAIIDQVDSMPPEMLEKLHGAVRYLGAEGGPRIVGQSPGAGKLPAYSAFPESPSGEPADPTAVPWWDPGADASVSPETDKVMVKGVEVSQGSRVVLRPVPGRSDAQDMFLEGRVARVEAVFFDIEDKNYLAVTIEGDGGAGIYAQHGRFLYFSPDEVEPLPEGAP